MRPKKYKINTLKPLILKPEPVTYNGKLLLDEELYLDESAKQNTTKRDLAMEAKSSEERISMGAYINTGEGKRIHVLYRVTKSQLKRIEEIAKLKTEAGEEYDRAEVISTVLREDREKTQQQQSEEDI